MHVVQFLCCWLISCTYGWSSCFAIARSSSGWRMAALQRAWYSHGSLGPDSVCLSDFLFLWSGLHTTRTIWPCSFCTPVDREGCVDIENISDTPALRTKLDPCPQSHQGRSKSACISPFHPGPTDQKYAIWSWPQSTSLYYCLCSFILKY